MLVNNMAPKCLLVGSHGNITDIVQRIAGDLLTLGISCDVVLILSASDAGLLSRL
uniref:Uncharacterized protein n=1 Tax=Picea glauca TaxID=3330 RepID=A0A117NHX8_PICGL|nr:hypothetical protein ABT39_MTgene4424 [Picea glauca]QHR86251.1 hypothetical protein Q903MT_gene250 [Picea sitchensis]